MLSQEEIFELFNNLYNNKSDYITLEEASQAAGCCVKTLRKWMKATNAYDNCPDVFRTILKTLHNFDKLDTESAYWIGYLMADGCLAKRNNDDYALMLECKIEDREILEKFCDYLQIRQDRITIGHQGASVCLNIANSNFSTSVLKYGIVPNKSHVETDVPKEILNDDDLFLQYIKGLIDGDGTIHTRKSQYGISILSNSKTQLETIKSKLELLLPNPKSIWLLTRDKDFIPKATQNLYYIKIGVGLVSSDINNLNYLYDKFYNNKKIILTRKEQLLKYIVEMPHKKTGSL